MDYTRRRKVNSTNPNAAIMNRFQMVSLLKLANVTEEGVRFLSPHDGSPMYGVQCSADECFGISPLTDSILGF